MKGFNSIWMDDIYCKNNINTYVEERILNDCWLCFEFSAIEYFDFFRSWIASRTMGSNFWNLLLKYSSWRAFQFCFFFFRFLALASTVCVRFGFGLNFSLHFMLLTYLIWRVYTLYMCISIRGQRGKQIQNWDNYNEFI